MKTRFSPKEPPLAETLPWKRFSHFLVNKLSRKQRQKRVLKKLGLECTNPILQIMDKHAAMWEVDGSGPYLNLLELPLSIPLALEGERKAPISFFWRASFLSTWSTKKAAP